MENKIIHGECLEEMDKLIEEGIKVDAIICDPPYGTVGESMQDNTGKYKKITASKWDNVINIDKLYNLANKILRNNGRMILFSQQPFTNKLLNKSHPNIPFSYTLYWNKLHFANCLSSNKACVSYIEEILLFSKRSPKHDFKGSHPLRQYFNDEKNKATLSAKNIKDILGNQMGSHYFTNGAQFCIPTQKNYEKLQETGYFLMEYKKIKEIDQTYRNNLIIDINLKYPSIFNLSEGKKYKSNILEYKKDYQGLHPTQKPVALMEDLIKTYTNKGETVLDFTMGSGSTGVACQNLNRKFIGIELDEGYFKIAEDRINSFKKDLKKS